MSSAAVTADTIATLEHRVAQAAKRWFTALTLDERAVASVALARATRALIVAEKKAERA